MEPLSEPWPRDPARLVELQRQLGDRAAAMGSDQRWTPSSGDIVGGCFVAFARGEAGPGGPGDRAWAGAVSWRSGPEPAVVATAVVADRVPARYVPGLLALREGAILAAAVAALEPPPDVVLVDATGIDHPRRAGLALHLGAALSLPTVGVTDRGFGQDRPPPGLLDRGDLERVRRQGSTVAAWVCTRSGTRPLLVHAAWRTDLGAAVQVVLAASSEAARTPHPLQEARRLAREARTAADPGPAARETVDPPRDPLGTRLAARPGDRQC